jgi:adenylate cyclase
VLDGHIRRGDVVDIEAVVCFCDLRDFTSLTRALDKTELLALLDEAFGVVVPPVVAQGGDVLKFVGDAVLAVFQAEESEASRRDAVLRAFRAACAAAEGARAANRQRLASGKSPLVTGMSLHLGRVAYGNIGAPGRLDFTVIGSVVNLSIRLEGLCRDLRMPIVMSDEVASRLDPEVFGDMELVDAGLQSLKGIAEPVRVFGVRPLRCEPACPCPRCRGG